MRVSTFKTPSTRHAVETAIDLSRIDGTWEEMSASHPEIMSWGEIVQVKYRGPHMPISTSDGEFSPGQRISWGKH